MLLKSFYMLPHWHKIQNWKYVSYIKISIPNWMGLYTDIHLIKCFPLKSYIWPHIGLDRSWRRFLFLSKLVMSPDNSRREAPFSSTYFQPRHGRRRQHCDPAPPHCLGEIRDSLNINIKQSLMHLVRNTIVSGQKGHLHALPRSVSPLALHLLGLVSRMWFFGRSFVPQGLWGLLPPGRAGCPQASMEKEAPSQFQYWFAEP